MAFNSCNGEILLFGGLTGSSLFHDTWTFNASTGIWKELHPDSYPSPRGRAGMAFDPRSGLMVLFGGFGFKDEKESKENVGLLGDTWTFNTEMEQWTFLSKLAHPPAQSPIGMDFDPCFGQILLFGSDGKTAQTWGLDTMVKQWTNLKPWPLPSLAAGSMAFNPCIGQDVLLQKQTTWTFDAHAKTWTPLTSVSPPVTSSSMAFALSSGQMIVFGGFATSSESDDTWTLSIAAPSDVEAIDGPLPPVHLRGCQQANRFATQTDYANVLTWDPPLGGTPIVKYRIYRLSQDPLLSKCIGEVSSQTRLRFKDHNRKKGKTYTYSIVSEDLLGAISSPVIVKVKGNEICRKHR